MFKIEIKTWEKMEEEFGLTKFSSINCKYSFTKYMEDNLPKNRIIYLNEYFLNDIANFSHDMIKDYFIMENIWNNIKRK